AVAVAVAAVVAVAVASAVVVAVGWSETAAGLPRREGELEALVRLLVPERAVEPVRVGPLLVGRELGERAAARDAPRVRPRHHGATDSLPPQPPVDPDRLD